MVHRLWHDGMVGLHTNHVVRCNVTEQTYEIILVLRHIPSLSNNIPAAIPAKAAIKVIGWTIPLMG